MAHSSQYLDIVEGILVDCVCWPLPLQLEDNHPVVMPCVPAKSLKCYQPQIGKQLERLNIPAANTFMVGCAEMTQNLSASRRNVCTPDLHGNDQYTVAP